MARSACSLSAPAADDFLNNVIARLVALLLEADWIVLLMVPPLLVLHYGVVKREEQYLERKFGQVYRN
jgi:protein-S-isoprenylcysteine O-methyltransferase Ste14